MSHTRRLSLSLLTLALLILLLGLSGPAPSLAGPATGPSYKIVTTETGLYTVSYADLVAAGFNPAGVDTATFQLFNFGQEVTIFLQDGGDSSFDSGDSFLFYAEARLTRYTDHNVYWFVAGEATRRLPTTMDGTPGAAPLDASFRNHIHFEENLNYKSSLPMTGDDADRWYWRFFQACAPGSRTCRDTFGYKNSRSFSGDVPAVSGNPFTGTLTIALRGSSNEFANPDHHVQVFVNGTQVGDSTFEGQALFITSYDVLAATLVSGANEFRFDFPDDMGAGVTNQGYVDYFTLAYEADFTAQNDRLGFSGDEPGPHRFQIAGFSDNAIVVLDVSEPLDPVWVNNVATSGAGPFSASFQADNGAGAASYFAASAGGVFTPDSINADTPSNLRDTNQGADYVVITPSAFLAPSQQLADYRALANGFRTMVIDVQDIYDEFNGGLMDPAAIRDFIRYAAHNWQPPRLHYIILMGDGHYDFLNHIGSTELIWIPPWLAAVDPFQGETAADNRYVDIFGDEQYDSDAGDDHTVSFVTVTDGHMVLSVDFGFIDTTLAAQASTTPQQPAQVKAIGDMVFWDEDLDGIWDANERGMPGVSVELWQGSTLIDTQVTDGNGNYDFEDIGSGTYMVKFVLPAGWSFTTRDVGDADPLDDPANDPLVEALYDSDADPLTGFTVPITYTFPETAKTHWDAGLVRPGTIGNRVWEDSDADGLQDPGEPGIAGVTVELLQGGGVISTTVTDASGYFYFFDQADGEYEVRIAASNFSGPLAGFIPSPLDQGFDTMPDLALGRFPVNTLQQADEMVNRVIHYETLTPSGDWQKRVVYVADDTDTAGNFYAHSNEVADHIWPYPADSVKVYYRNNYFTTAEMKNAIVSNINQGAVFVTFNGHSSKVEWGGGDRFFTASDINSLNNTIFPIFLPMTCLEGQYINPGTPALGEVAVRTIGKGAVASFSPTGLGVATGHQFLYNAFFEGVVNGVSKELGDLTNYSKDALFQSHSLFKDLLDTYVLFGDPAMAARVQGDPAADPAILKEVEPAATVYPGDTITYTLTYSNAGQIPAVNVVITDLLPSGLQNPSVSSSPPLAQNPGPDYSWSAGNLDPGEGGTITIVATVDAGFATPGQIPNTALIAADGEDANPFNNQSSTLTGVDNPPGAMQGVAFRDPNANGILDVDELLRVPGVPITATRLSTGVAYTTVTDGSGDWQLTGLPPGPYEVVAPQSLPGLFRMTPAPLSANVPSGGTVTDVNFGYISPTAVALATFQAALKPAGVTLIWQTASEANLQGFYVRRGPNPAEHGKRISALLPAAGAGASYRYVDASVSGTDWFYWLEAVETGGPSQFFGPVTVPPPDPGPQSSRLFLGLVLR